MRLDKLITLGIVTAAGIMLAEVRTPVPPNPGPPSYTDVQRLQDGSPYFFHDNEWAAFVFLRDPACVPPTFNLLDSDDLTPAFPGGPPRPFVCPMTVSGFAIWKNGPPPIDFVPVQVSWQGLGAVPVWFAKLSEVQAATADDTLTVAELLALPSLRKGFAKVYSEVDHPGVLRPQGPGNGSIQVVANGFLQDGVSFQLEWHESGIVNGGGVSFIRHARIDFK